MLKLVRITVRLLVMVGLPTLCSGTSFLVLLRLGFGAAEAVVLAALVLIVLASLGLIETGFYVRELRSVTPKPLRAAGRFVSALAFIFLLTTFTFLGCYLAPSLLGLPGGMRLFSPLGAFLAYAGLSWLLLTPSEELVRGRKYRSFREVSLLSRFEQFLCRGERIFFGGISLPWSTAVKHWLILGVTGAGKTMIFQLLIQCTLRGRLGRGRDERGILYDNKTEIVPLLAALGIPYKIAHPFDRRGVALDLSSMVPTHTHALELAAILMPQAKNVGSDPFWIDAPRNLLASVLTSLRLGRPEEGGRPTPIDWDFRDVVLTLQSQERIREIIVRHPETRTDIEGYFDDPRLLANVMATIKTATMYYRPIAACWARATERISLTEAVWGKEEYLLVLGNDEEARQAVNAINRAIVTRYGQLALKRPPSRTRRIWFWFDEFSDLKRIDPDLMAGLLTKGRSKGVAVLIGLQSLLSVISEYGREVGKTILSQCQNICILGLGDLDDETADYAQRVVGQSERQEERQSETAQGLFTKRTTSEQITSRSVVLSSEFADLPETARENGLAGYYRTRSISGFWGAVLPGAFLDRELVRPAEHVPAIEERDLDDHELRPWDEVDFRRLGLKPDGESRTEAARAQSRPLKPFRVVRGGKRVLTTGF